VIYYYFSAQKLKLIFTVPRTNEGKKAESTSVAVTYHDGLPAHRWSPIQVLTGPGIE